MVGPLAGAWIDRHDKRWLLIGVQSIFALQSLLRPILARVVFAADARTLGLAGAALLLYCAANRHWRAAP